MGEVVERPLCGTAQYGLADSTDDLYCRASLVGEIPTDAKPVRARVMALLQKDDPTRTEQDEGTVSAGPSSPRIAPRGIAVGAAPPQQLRFNLFALLKARDAYPPPPSASALMQPAIMPLFDLASTTMAPPMPPFLAPASTPHAFSPPSFALGTFNDPTFGFGAMPGPATGSDDLDFAAALGLGGGGEAGWSIFAGPSWFTQTAMF